MKKTTAPTLAYRKKVVRQLFALIEETQTWPKEERLENQMAAAFLGMSKYVVTFWKKGQHPPRAGSLLRLEEFLRKAQDREWLKRKIRAAR